MNEDNRTGRELDLVVYGATGFVGKLVAEYLAAHAPAGVRIGLAGRSEARLEGVRSDIDGASDWPLIVADSSDDTSLETMASRTKVLLTTVGPYAKYGLPVVAACAAQGTHYADLTGEVLFMRESAASFDALAKQTGARIVHSCGFDSIPSDLGVLALHLAAAEDGAGALGATVNGVVSISGGISGGTIASLIGQLEQSEVDPDLARAAADPYALSPDRESDPSGKTERDLRSVAFDNDLDSWVAPFLMAGVNTRVVRRSNALAGYPYSHDFRYREVLATGSGPRGALIAGAITGVMGVGFLGLSNQYSRGLLERVIPEPGDGPSERTRDSGSFVMKTMAHAASGTRYAGKVAADGDPGYKATSLMMSECGLVMALQEADLPAAAGVLTPATALGRAGIERLRAAGMTIEAARID